ncbi:uncharacterized protein LOC143020501 [Oratosquilla oratoria]|uniref:uncharacterized protein LOC143020501 n=1 Tax=Oratosquilla oratoria TaxID=337810 RepID=UPI003F76435F
MEEERYNQDAYGSANVPGGDGGEEEENKEEDDQKRQMQEALEEQEVEELLELVQTLTILPYKSELRWTKHHQDLIRGFLRNTKRRLLCCYLLFSQPSSTSVIPPDQSPNSPGSPADGGPSPSAADKPPERRLTVSYMFPTSQRFGSVWFFLRIHGDNSSENDNDCCSEKSRNLGGLRLTMENFDRYVMYGTLETGRPEALQSFLEGPYQTFLQREPQHLTLRNDILRTFFALGAEAVYHVGEVTGNPALFLPKETLALDDKDTKGLVQDVDLVNRIEELVLCWMDQLHTQSFQLGDSTSPLEEGLLHEVRRWKKRSKALSMVLRLVASPVVARILVFLRSHYSPFVLLFQEAVRRLQVHMYKYLHVRTGILVHLRK